MNPNTTSHDDDVPAEVAFASGRRGQFYQAGAQLNLPLHLKPEVQRRLADLASAKGVELSAWINALLKKDIELIEIGR